MIRPAHVIDSLRCVRAHAHWNERGGDEGVSPLICYYMLLQQSIMTRGVRMLFYRF